MGVMPLWAAATSCTDCAMVSVYLHTFPHTFHHFPLFTVSTASTFIIRTGGHFPAAEDRLRQAPLAENGPGGPFLAGDTYLRDRTSSPLLVVEWLSYHDMHSMLAENPEKSTTIRLIRADVCQNIANRGRGR